MPSYLLLDYSVYYKELKIYKILSLMVEITQKFNRWRNMHNEKERHHAFKAGKLA